MVIQYGGNTRTILNIHAFQDDRGHTVCTMAENHGSLCALSRIPENVAAAIKGSGKKGRRLYRLAQGASHVIIVIRLEISITVKNIQGRHTPGLT
jgi:hypothetical protein